MGVNIKLNYVIFFGVLFVCIYTGMVVEGMRIFDLMVKYSLKLRFEYYVILIDLFGRNNRFDEVVELIERVSGGSDYVGMWGVFLGVCRVYGNMGFVRKVVEMFFYLELSNIVRYVMLLNIYVVGKRWDDFC